MDSKHQGQSALLLRTLEGGIHDLLAETGDVEGQGPDEGGSGFEVVEDVLDGITIGEGRRFDRNGVAFRMGAGLHPEGLGVIVAGDRAFSSSEDESALGLGLMGPGIGECTPASFRFAKAKGVANHSDGVLIHFQALRDVPRAGDFKGRTSAEVPGAECGAIAHVI